MAVAPPSILPSMLSAETQDDIDIEAGVVRAARLTFLGSLLFWPLFLLAEYFMLGPPARTSAGVLWWHLLIYGTWLYPVAVGLGWWLSRRAVKLGRADVICLLPWLLPALVFCYWLGYFLL